MNSVTIYKGLHPSRECLDSGDAVVSFNPGDNGLQVVVGGHQITLSFEAINEINSKLEVVYQNHPNLRPDGK